MRWENEDPDCQCGEMLPEFGIDHNGNKTYYPRCFACYAEIMFFSKPAPSLVKTVTLAQLKRATKAGNKWAETKLLQFYARKTTT